RAATPFGFAAGRWNQIFVSNTASPSSMSSYDISENGDVEATSRAVVTSQNAACWASHWRGSGSRPHDRAPSSTFASAQGLSYKLYRDDALGPASNVRLRPGPIIETVRMAL